jgi:thermitase
MRWCLAWLVALTMLESAGSAFGQEYVPNELLVKFQPGTPAAVRAAVYQALGATVQQRLSMLGVDVVGLPPGITPQQAAAVCSHSTWVQYAEPDPVFAAASVPNDPSFAQQWGLTKIQAPQAWDVTQGSPGVPIAILDSGIDQSHPDLAPKIVANANFSTSSTVDDLYGHGTHLAGIAAAITNNGAGIAGVGYNCTLMNGKVAEDSNGATRATALAQGIMWAADSGAKVICMSLGSPTSSQTVADAVDYAWNAGVVLVASAGNSNSTAANYPAAYPDCISVAATDPSDQREVASTGGSTFGSWVDVAAPGLNIFSTVPNRPNISRQQGYGVLSGTSQSAAFVAGLAGLVWSTPFGTSNAAVRARIEATCDRIPGTGTLWASGRINAARAVAEERQRLSAKARKGRKREIRTDQQNGPLGMTGIPFAYSLLSRFRAESLPDRRARSGRTKW